MTEEEATKGTRVKYWSHRLDEYQYGSISKEPDVNGAVRVCMDDDILPVRTFYLWQLEKE